MHEIAQILENRYKTENLLTALKFFLTEDAFSGKELAEHLTNFERKEIQTLLMLLKSADILRVVNPGPSIMDYLLKVDYDNLSEFEKGIKSLVNLISEMKPTSQIKIESEVKITATMPDIFYKKGKPPRIPSVASTMAKLITKAENEIWIVNPFFDEFATAHLQLYLNDAVKRGVDVKIITRPSSKSEGNIASIKYLLTSLENPQRMEIRTFYTTERDTWYSIHSKILLIDEKQCYIGSANITEGSFNKNFEMGVVVTGKCVESVYSIILEIWKMSISFF